MSIKRGGATTYDVYVGNLPADIEEAKFRSLFDKFGELHSVTITDNKKRDDGTKVGYARYLEEGQAIKAATEMKNYNMGTGKNLFVMRTSRGGKKDQEGGGKPERGDRGDRRSGDSGGQGQGHRGMQPDIVPNHQSGTSSVAPPQVIRTERLMVTHVEDPTSFWAQVMDEGVQELFQIGADLSNVCPTAPRIQGPPVSTKIYGAMYSSDQTWYRCKALTCVSDTQTEMQYIDYGNKEVKENTEIVELPSSLSGLKPHAQLYTLYNIKPLSDDPNSIGYVQGKETLQNLTQDRLLQASVYNSRSVGKIPVTLEFQNEDINQEMLNLGFAERVKPRSSGSGGFQQRIGGGGDAKPKVNMGPWTPSQHQPEQKPKQGRAILGDQQQKPGEYSMPHKHHYDRQQMGGPTTINVSQPPPPLQQPRQGTGWTAGGRQFRLGAGDQQMESAPQEQTNIPDLRAVPTQAPAQRKQQSLRGQQGSTSDAEVSRLRQELAAAQMEVRSMGDKLHYTEERLQEEIDYIKGERDSAIIDLATCKGALRNKENDLHLVTAQLADSNIANKIKNLMITLQKVKLLRGQVPTDSDARDLIKEAIENATEEEGRIQVEKLTIISSVEAALEEYRKAQDAIKACQAADELLALRPARDDARTALHKVLSKFIQVVSCLPLEARCTQVEELVKKLEETYRAFIRVEVTEQMNWENALHIYQEWKALKGSEFQEVRTATNTCHNAVNSALQLLQKQLSLELVTAEAPKTMVDLESLVTRFHNATLNEITITDMENSPDMSILAVVIQKALRTLRSELRDIQQLQQLMLDYRELWMQLKPWLTDKLDMEPIQACRKTIKGLKSKLRHKLADRQDLEENEDQADLEELQQVEKDLADIRTQLQAAFLEDDKHLAQLADLNENHFPELAMLYPDLGINTEGEYGGLLKVGRALDQYSTEPLLEGGKKTVFISTHNGTPVLIKELIVGESVGVKKADFLRRAAAYHSIKNPSLLPVLSVFFDKNEKYAYIVTQKHCSLEKHLQGPPLAHKMVFYILQGVLKGLHSLHEAKLTHGSLHPRNVLVCEDGRGVLGDYDFTRSLKQRAEQRYTTSSGLTFVAPEVKNGSEVTRACDIFSFGLLVLWLYFPDVKVEFGPDGAPDPSGLNMKEPLSSLLIETLCAEPSLRPTTANLMSHPYFTHSPSSRPSSPEAGAQQHSPSDTSPAELKSILKPNIDSPERTETLPGLPKSVAFSDSHHQSPVAIAADIAAQFSRENGPRRQVEVPKDCQLRDEGADSQLEEEPETTDGENQELEEEPASDLEDEDQLVSPPPGPSTMRDLILQAATNALLEAEAQQEPGDIDDEEEEKAAGQGTEAASVTEDDDGVAV